MVKPKRPVYNYDKNGNLIEDISKVEVPMHIIKGIFEILNPHLEWDESIVIREAPSEEKKV